MTLPLGGIDEPQETVLAPAGQFVPSGLNASASMN